MRVMRQHAAGITGLKCREDGFRSTVGSTALETEHDLDGEIGWRPLGMAHNTMDMLIVTEGKDGWPWTEQEQAADRQSSRRVPSMGDVTRTYRPAMSAGGSAAASGGGPLL